MFFSLQKISPYIPGTAHADDLCVRTRSCLYKNPSLIKDKMQTKFVNRNIKAESLLSLDCIKHLVLPRADSPLMQKNPDFIDSLVNHQVIAMEIQKFPNNLDFQVITGVREQVLFAELLRIAQKRKIPMNNVAKIWGFDIKELPDSAYLLHAIYHWDSKSPLIEHLPNKITSRQNHMQKEYEVEKLRALVQDLQISGVAKNVRINIFSKIGDHIKILQDIFMTYHLTKYEMPTLRQSMGQALELAAKNQCVSALLLEAKAFSFISAEHTESLTDAAKEQLALLKARDDSFPEEQDFVYRRR